MQSRPSYRHYQDGGSADVTRIILVALFTAITFILLLVWIDAKGAADLTPPSPLSTDRPESVKQEDILSTVSAETSKLDTTTSEPMLPVMEHVPPNLANSALTANFGPDPVIVYLPAIRRSVTLFIPFLSTPRPFSNPHPAHDATERSPNTYLTWQLDLPDAAQYHYSVQLEANTVNPTTVLGSSIHTTHLDPPTLLYGTRYSWRVIASNDAGERFVGPVWSFETMAPIPDTPDIETMVYVPSGEFQMGCDPTVSTIYPCFAREKPLHRVYLDSYWIDKYEVTNLQYRRCVQADQCNPPRRFNSFKRDNYFMNPTYDYYPVMYVSWWDAQDYCSWVGKRLLTEAEWEKAARGAIDTRTWPWGEDAPDCTRITHLPDGTLCTQVVDSQRVGSFPANISPYGALDMSGNVFEWVYDRYNVSYYEHSPYDNPTGPTSGDLFFSIRGGGYRDNWYYMRTSHRHAGHHGDRPFQDAPYYRSERLGFRCGRTAASN